MPEETSTTAPPARLQPSASYSFTVRLHLPPRGEAFARVAQVIADAEGMLGAIDLVRVESERVVRDLTVACADSRRVSMAIHEDPAKAWALTVKGNTVAVVSDGTAVLSLGDIGPEAAMPVMEGKAIWRRSSTRSGSSASSPRT